jgi:hypothetical protein
MAWLMRAPAPLVSTVGDWAASGVAPKKAASIRKRFMGWHLIGREQEITTVGPPAPLTCPYRERFLEDAKNSSSLKPRNALPLTPGSRRLLGCRRHARVLS